MDMNGRRAVLLLLIVLGGCASMPTGTVGYYLPRGDFDVVITQTAACAKELPVLKTDVSVVPVYERDPAKFVPVDLGPFNKGKATLVFSFYDDGRLKGVNTSQTGQGGEVLSTVAKLLPVVGLQDIHLFGLSRQALLSAYSLERGDKLTEDQIGSLLRGNLPTADCEALKAISADKPVSVIREARGVLQTEPEKPSDALPFELVQTTLPKDVFQTVTSIFGRASATLTLLPMEACLSKENSPQPHCVTSRANGSPTLALRQPARVRVSVTILGAATGNHVFEKEVMIPQYGESLELPIGKPRAFGESTFQVALSESGSVQSLGFSRGGGASASINAIQALAGALGGDSVAERAAAFKAEADLIAQQQRLIRCQLAPENCT